MFIKEPISRLKFDEVRHCMFCINFSYFCWWSSESQSCECHYYHYYYYHYYYYYYYYYYYHYHYHYFYYYYFYYCTRTNTVGFYIFLSTHFLWNFIFHIKISISYTKWSLPVNDVGFFSCLNYEWRLVTFTENLKLPTHVRRSANTDDIGLNSTIFAW